MATYAPLSEESGTSTWRSGNSSLSPKKVISKLFKADASLSTLQSSHLREARAKLRWQVRHVKEPESWCSRHYGKPWVPVEPDTCWNCWGCLTTPFAVGAKIFLSRMYTIYDIGTDMLVVIDLIGGEEPQWMITVSISLMVLPVLIKVFLFRYLSEKLLTGDVDRGGYGLSQCVANTLYIFFSFFYFALIELYLLLFYPWKKPNHMILTPVDRLGPVLETLFESTLQMLFQCWIYVKLNQNSHHFTDPLGEDQSSEVKTHREIRDEELNFKLLISIVPSIVAVIWRLLSLRMEAHAISMHLPQMLAVLFKAPLGISAPFLDLLADKTIDVIDYTGVGPLNDSQQQQIFQALTTEEVMQAIEFDDSNMLHLEENAAIIEGCDNSVQTPMQTPFFLRRASFGFRHNLEDAYVVLKALTQGRAQAESVEIGLVCLDGPHIQDWLDDVTPTLKSADAILEDGIAGRVHDSQLIVDELQKHLEETGLYGGCWHVDKLRKLLEPALAAEQRLALASTDVLRGNMETMTLPRLQFFIQEVGPPFDEAMREAKTLGLDESIIKKCCGGDAERRLTKLRQRFHALNKVSQESQLFCDDYDKFIRQSQKPESQALLDNFLDESRQKLKVVLNEAMALGVNDSSIMDLDEMKKAQEILTQAAQVAQEKRAIIDLTWDCVAGIQAAREELVLNPITAGQAMETFGNQIRGALEAAEERGIDVCEGDSERKDDLKKALQTLMDFKRLATEVDTEGQQGFLAALTHWM